MFLVVNLVDGISNTMNSGGFVFSNESILSGIFDALIRILAAWLTVIPIYFIRLFIRKKIKKTEQSINSNSVDSESEPMDSEDSKFRHLKVPAVVATVFIIILTIAISSDDGFEPINLNSSNSSLDSEVEGDIFETEQDESQVFEDSSWVPEGFSIWAQEEGIAWRWLESSEFNCSYGDYCWGIYIVARDGCPSGLYAAISILDKSDVQIDFSNDSFSSSLPMQKSKMIFETFNDESESARLSEVSCY